MSELQIRPAVVADAAALAYIQVVSYRTAYAGIMPDDYLGYFTLEEEAEDWRRLLAGDTADRLLVAVVDAAVIGYALGRPASDVAGYACELVALHVLREQQRRGSGAALFVAMAKALRDGGCASLMLWTLERNPIRRWYEQLGGTLVARKQYEIDGTEIVEVAYGWPSIEPLRMTLEHPDGSARTHRGA